MLFYSRFHRFCRNLINTWHCFKYLLTIIDPIAYISIYVMLLIPCTVNSPWCSWVSIKKKPKNNINTSETATIAIWSCVQTFHIKKSITSTAFLSRDGTFKMPLFMVHWRKDTERAKRSNLSKSCPIANYSMANLTCTVMWASLSISGERTLNSSLAMTGHSNIH